MIMKELFERLFEKILETKKVMDEIEEKGIGIIDASIKRPGIQFSEKCDIEKFAAIFNKEVQMLSHTQDGIYTHRGVSFDGLNINQCNVEGE